MTLEAHPFASRRTTGVDKAGHGHQGQSYD